MRRYLIAIASVLLIAVRPAQAQTASPDTVDVIDIWNQIRHKAPPANADDYTKRMKALAPVIGVKPSAGVMFGVAGNVAFFAGDPKTTHISSLVASLTFSQKKQTSLTGRMSLSARDDRWRLDGDNRAQWTSQDTYGLGTSSERAAGINAKYNFFRVHETFLRQIRPSLFAGAGFHYDDHTDIRPGTDLSDAEWTETAFVQYSGMNDLPLERQISAGPSITFVADTRDNAINPYAGWFTAASYRGLIKGFLGGSSGWQLVHVDGRSYYPIGSENRQRIAIWVFGDFTFNGAPPYFDLPATGMDMYGRSARGYGEARFRGERLLYGEVEYRGTLMQNGLLGWVAFLNATTISNLQSGERLFHSGAPGAGAGLRALLNKRSRTNLCFDIGFGKDGSRGVYLAVQEAF